jgi:hypothetical protein
MIYDTWDMIPKEQKSLIITEVRGAVSSNTIEHESDVRVWTNLLKRLDNGVYNSGERL